MISLELDPAFADFNICESWDPTLPCGPSVANLHKLIYRARKGERVPAAEFAETMFWTLRPETWDCFQRVNGNRPISHRDWFYAKQVQFFDILVYDQLTILQTANRLVFRLMLSWTTCPLLPGVLDRSPSRTN